MWGGDFVQKLKDDVLYSFPSSSIFLQQMACVAIVASSGLEIKIYVRSNQSNLINFLFDELKIACVVLAQKKTVKCEIFAQC